MFKYSLLIAAVLSLPAVLPAETESLKSLNLSTEWAGSDGRILPDVSVGIELGESTVIFRRSSTIDLLLKSAGILPTTDSYAVVYQLNPHLEILGRIPNGEQISLPSVVGGPEALNLIRDGKFVRLSLNLELKGQLCGGAPILNVDWRRINDLGDQSPVAKYATTIRDAVTAFQISCRANQLMSSEHTLEQVLADMNASQALLNKGLSMQQLSDEEIAEMASIAEDLALKQQRLTESRGEEGIPKRPKDEVSVRINVIDKSGKPLPNLRIYWEPRITWNSKRDLGTAPTLTPDVDTSMSESWYFFWAAAPGRYTNGDVKKPSDANLLEVKWMEDEPVKIMISAVR